MLQVDTAMPCPSSCKDNRCVELNSFRLEWLSSGPHGVTDDARKVLSCAVIHRRRQMGIDPTIVSTVKARVIVRLTASWHDLLGAVNVVCMML